MTDDAREHEAEQEEPKSHELDLLDLVAARNEKHRLTVERLHGVEINDQQEDHDE